MKKAFTLLEVMISVTIFLIILSLMYKVLDDIEISDKIFDKQLNKHDESNFLYKIVAEDIAESTQGVNLVFNSDNNAILSFKTNNSFHNAFYSYVTYMIGSNGSFLRIESKDEFNKDKLTQSFLNDSYIDELLVDVKKFAVSVKDDKYVFVFEKNSNEKIMFSTFRLE